MIVYFLSGLGADKRAFQKLHLPKNWKIKHLAWPALSENETFSSYCTKISALIDTSESFAVIGLSFGGMVATELAKKLQPKTTIIISSVSTKYELPFIMKISRWFKLNKIVPALLLIRFTLLPIGFLEQKQKKKSYCFGKL